MSLICKEDLLKDIEETVVFSGKAGYVSAEMQGANKVIDRIHSALAVSESHGGCKFCLNDKFESVGLNDHGVYMSCGSSRPPEHEKFRFCPNCGKKL